MSEAAATRPVSVDALANLRAPFPKSALSKLPKITQKDGTKSKCAECGGYLLPHIHLDYAGHAAVTDRLLSVDPLWSWEPLSLGPTGLPAVSEQGGTLALWIRLTVCGVTRLGVGTCAPKPDAVKELIGDAIRNAAMRFGVGLDLWSKDELESHAEHPNQRPPIQGAPKQDAAAAGPPEQGEASKDAPAAASTDGASGGEAEQGTPSPNSATPGAPLLTTPQLKKLHAMCKDMGMDDDARHVKAGRSFAALTKTQAKQLIDELETGDLTPWPCSMSNPERNALARALNALEPEKDRANQLFLSLTGLHAEKRTWDKLTLADVRAMQAAVEVMAAS